jgi:hypothetical protein
VASVPIRLFSEALVLRRGDTLIPLDQVLADAEFCEVDGSESYHLCYRHFLHFFDTFPKVTSHHLVIAASFTYSWMPTILTLKAELIDRVADLVESVRHGISLSVAELEIMKATVNNSVVGSSKLLHFANPNMYPIIDSRVHAYIFGRKHQSLLTDPEWYQEYSVACREAAQDPRLTPVVESFCQQLGYGVSPLRVLELIMYLRQREEAHPRGPLT